MTPPMAWTPRSCLLDRLPGHLCTRLAPELQHVDLPVGKLLMESGCGNQVFFIRSGIVSLLYLTAAGESGEIASLGNEGMVGMSLLTGDSTVKVRAVVQAPGEAFAVRAEVVAYSDWEQTRSMAKVKEQGRSRLEGKEYVVQDGDIINIRSGLAKSKG